MADDHRRPPAAGGRARVHSSKHGLEAVQTGESVVVELDDVRRERHQVSPLMRQAAVREFARHLNDIRKFEEGLDLSKPKTDQSNSILNRAEKKKARNKPSNAEPKCNIKKRCKRNPRCKRKCALRPEFAFAGRPR